MKRFLTLLLAAAMVLSFAACGDNGTTIRNENEEDNVKKDPIAAQYLQDLAVKTADYPVLPAMPNESELDEAFSTIDYDKMGADAYEKAQEKIWEDWDARSNAYYDALKAVHDVVKGGVKVKKSIGLVADISEIYVRNYQKMLGDPNYTPDELSTISFGYAKLLSESADILQDLKNVVNVTGMSLSDAERLAIIDQSYKRLLEYRNLVQYYTDKNISVSYLRAKKKKDADRVVALYGDAEDRYW